MKRLYKKISIGIFSILLLISSSCEDFLDRYPDNALTATQLFTDIEYAQTTITALYDLLSDSYLLGRNVPLRGSLKGTDFFHFTENPNLRFDQEYKYTEISSDAGYGGYLWNYAYKVIANSNSLIAVIPQLDGDQATKDHFMAQAMAAKSIAYIELLKAFSYPLWMAKDDPVYEMGVPLLKTELDNANAIANPPTRAGLENCFNYVIDQIKAAIELIDKTKTEKQYITEQALWAILARVYLYTEEWGLAKDAALEAEALGGSMIAKSGYIASLTQRFNNESIFEIYYDANDNLELGAITYYAYKSVNASGRIDASSVGYGEYGASNTFINLFVTEDVRNELFKEDKTSSSSSLPGEEGYSGRAYHKYVGIESNVIFDVPYVRLPEVLLMVAEAYSEIPGNDTTALEYLNKVYTARTGLTLSDLTGQDLKTAIFNERRRELALEGHELYDYLRKKRAFSRDGSHPSPLSIDPVNGRNATLFHRVVYPIPQPEMDANPNIRDQQNPGYADYQGSAK